MATTLDGSILAANESFVSFDDPAAAAYWGKSAGAKGFADAAQKRNQARFDERATCLNRASHGHANPSNTA
ncbi:MAG: hypothetical protein ACREC0_08330 [Methylocella sp.]